MRGLLLFLFTGLFCQFAFAEDALLLKTPANGEVISGGDYYTINWESSNVENIKIEYSIDGGASWLIIADSYAASAGKYLWLVPAKPTTKGKIRISDIFNGSTASINPGTFTIAEPQLILDTDTSLALVQGNAFRIGWKSLTVEKVNLYYSVDGGSSYMIIRKGFPALAGSFVWVVPEINKNHLSLKIESADSAAIHCIWQNATLIKNAAPLTGKYKGGSFDGHSTASNKPSELSLVFPAGNENLASSSLQSIKWTSSNIEYIKIEFSPDSGLTWATISESYPAYAKKLDWTVPSQITTKGIIRISSTEKSNLKALNPTPFKIPLKSIALIEDTESTYLKQQPVQISWVNNGVDLLSIFYRTGTSSNWTPVKTSISATLLNYIWIPPTNLSADSLQFKIISTDQTVQDSSKKMISIYATAPSMSKFKGGSYDGFSAGSNKTPKIELLAPSAGSKLNAYSTMNINWKSEHIEAVNIYFSSDSGRSWTEVVKSYSGNALKYQWVVPDAPTVSGFLRITSSDESAVSDTSGKFEINKAFVKINPDSLFSGDINTVISFGWSQSGVSKVKLLMKPKNDGNWTNIISKFDAAAGSYLYVLKQRISGLHYLKLVSEEAEVVKDSILVNFEPFLKSSSAAKYKGGGYDGHTSRSNVSKILVTKPQRGEVLISGTTYTITWSTVNISDSVKIEYSTDNGITWKVISVAVDSKAGSYLWSVPGTISGKVSSSKNPVNRISSILSDCKIRISETTSQDEVVGLSNDTFIISGTAIPPAPKLSTITFASIIDKTFGTAPFSLNASASSGLFLTFSIVSGPATIAGDIVTLTGGGTVKVKASHNATSDFLAAEAVIEFQVLPKPGTIITFEPISDKLFGTAPFTLIASASSGLPITFSILSGPATISGSIITLTGVGTVKVKALQEASNEFLAAEATSEFEVLPKPETIITFEPIADKLFGTASFTLFASASSGLPITFSIVSGPATISGSIITLTGVGSVRVKASHAGNGNFEAAEVIRTFRVNLPATNFIIKSVSATCKSSNNGKIDIKAANAFAYSAKLTGPGLDESFRFKDSLSVNNLGAGIYSVCISIEGQQTSIQCYELTIDEPKDLSAYVAVDKTTNLININLRGATTYSISNNGKTYTTSENFISIPLLKGDNVLKISSSISCQGMVEKRLPGNDDVVIFPNPFENILRVDLSKVYGKREITITDLTGKVVYSKTVQQPGTLLEIELSYLMPGVYNLRLRGNDFQEIYKVLKK